MRSRLVVGAVAAAAVFMGVAPAVGADDTYQRPDDPDVIESGSSCTFFGKDHMVHADVRGLDGDDGVAPAGWQQWMTDNSMNAAPSIWTRSADAGNGLTVWGMPVLVTNSSTTTTSWVNVWNPSVGTSGVHLPSGTTRYAHGGGAINTSSAGSTGTVESVQLRIKSAWRAMPNVGPWWAPSFSADNAFIEGDAPHNHGDRHMLVVDTTDCRATEFITTMRPGAFGNILSNGGYEFGASSGVEWDLTSNAIHRGVNSHFSGVDAPRNPMSSLVVRRDEMSDGAAVNFDGRNDDTPLDHALRFCLPAALIRDVETRWPAVASDGTNTVGSTDATAPVMGSRVRLDPDLELSDLVARHTGWDDVTPIGGTGTSTPTVGYTEAIFKALQVHGMILSDSCVNNWTISGDPDTKWTAAELNALKTLRLSDFELVDAEPMRAVTGTLSQPTPNPTLESRWFEIN